MILSMQSTCVAKEINKMKMCLLTLTLGMLSGKEPLFLPHAKGKQINNEQENTVLFRS